MNIIDQPLIDSLTDEQVMALTLAGEAEGEVIEGIVGCANVIWNRSKLWNKTIRQVCLQQNQFSCWLSVSSSKDYNRIIDYANQLTKGIVPYNLKQSAWVAHGIISGDLKDNTNGALYYLTVMLFNRKAAEYNKFLPMKKLGDQLFYRG